MKHNFEEHNIIALGHLQRHWVVEVFQNPQQRPCLIRAAFTYRNIPFSNRDRLDPALALPSHYYLFHRAVFPDIAPF
jgi:hypothetical protein